MRFNNNFKLPTKKYFSLDDLMGELYQINDEELNQSFTNPTNRRGESISHFKPSPIAGDISIIRHTIKYNYSV